MAIPSWLLVFVGGTRSQRPGPSPTLGSLGPSHQRRHKSPVSLQSPPCVQGVSGTPYGEVRDMYTRSNWNIVANHNEIVWTLPNYTLTIPQNTNINTIKLDNLVVSWSTKLYHLTIHYFHKCHWSRSPCHRVQRKRKRKTQCHGG